MIELERMLEPTAVGNDPVVLCVDDEPEVLSALGRTLRREPYDLLRARDAREALELLERFPVKVVVTDERMPAMPGTELLTRIRKIRPLVGRIILTGYPDAAMTIRSLEVGADFLMTKPWDEDMLRRTIRCLIHRVGSGGPGSPAFPEPWRDFGGEGG